MVNAEAIHRRKDTQKGTYFGHSRYDLSIKYRSQFWVEVSKKNFLKMQTQTMFQKYQEGTVIDQNMQIHQRANQIQQERIDFYQIEVLGITLLEMSSGKLQKVNSKEKIKRKRFKKFIRSFLISNYFIHYQLSLSYIFLISL